MPIAWSLGKHIVMGDDLVLGFLNLDQLTKLIRFARLTLANDLRVFLEQTEQLVGELRDALQHAGSGLLDHLAQASSHRLQLLGDGLYLGAALCAQPIYLGQNSLRVVQDLPYQPQQLAILSFALFFSFAALVPQRMR